jgi:hypothetical protein
MTYFRRFVIGVTELLTVLSILIGTCGGASMGRLLGQFAATNPNTSQQEFMRQTVSVAGHQMALPEFLGLLFGGGLGFIIPAVAASVLFVLIEIQRSCRQTAATLAVLSGNPAREPQF